MPIDPSIAMGVKAPQFESPVNQLAQLLQVQSAQQQNQLGQAKLDEYQRATGRQNLVYQKMRELGDTATDDQRVGALKSLGEFDAADKVMAGQLARTKTDAEAKRSIAAAMKDNADVLNLKLQHHRDQLGPINDQQSAAAWVAAMYQDKDMAPIVQASGRTLEQTIASIPKDPTGFAQWKMQSSLGADKLVQFTTADANTVANNRQSGANAKLAADTARRGQDISASTAIRGQDLTDARARDQLAQGKAPAGYRANQDGSLVPIPGGPADPKNKPPTEFQGKSAAFGARAEESDRILTELEGKYSPAGINSKNALSDLWVVGGALGAGANNRLSDASQRADQAQRDFINAVLRQESGAAIGAGEFDNARKQYFPQTGDSTAVIEQKAANRKLAVQGLKTNAGPAAFSAPPPSKNAKGWTLMVDAQGNRAYVSPDGKQHEDVH